MGHKALHEHGRQGPFPIVETVNIKDHFVLFEGGLVAKVESYLDDDGERVDLDDAAEATSCIVEHPDHGFIMVAIAADPITFN